MRDVVLIVEDNPMTSQLASFVLEDADFDVHLALDAAAALRILDQIAPDIVLMDLQLPDMSGLELTRRLKADPATRDLFIVAFSADDDPESVTRVTEAGCAALLSKPFNTKTFADQVRALISSR